MKMKHNKICQMCGNKYVISHYAYTNKNSRIKEYCFHCTNSYIRRLKFFKKVPESLWKDLVTKNEIDFDLGLKIFGSESKIKVYFKGSCKKCNCEFRSRYDKLKSRKVFPMIKLCTTCVRSETSKSDVARRSNSKAQLIAQNLPHVRHGNVQRSKTWRNNLSSDDKKYYLKPFTDHNLKIQSDPVYARGLRVKSGVMITGEFHVDDQWVKFDSGYELLFLNSLMNKNLIIRRCNFCIPYDQFKYNPDFLIINGDDKTIVEIKGSFYKNRIVEKQKAANDYITKYGIANRYEIYDQKFLIANGILEKESSSYVWKQIKGIYNGKNIRFTNEKHKEIAEIGRSRWYKKNKNRIDN